MAHFGFFVDRGGYHRWRLVAGNGEIVAASEAYTTKYSAKRSARRVKELAGDASIDED